jgi:hypothetical protein
MTPTAPLADLSAALLQGPPTVLSVGLAGFNDSIASHGGQVEQLDWRPPGNADPALAWALARLLADERVALANREAAQRIIDARPVWEDIVPRADAVWPEMKSTRLLLHAGPPVAWAEMCGPMHGAMIGAALYEGWAALARSRRGACSSAARSSSRSATTSAPSGP